jgi:hypothetical protein
MSQPFGHSLNLILSPARTWLKLGPGWAMLGGVISSGAFALEGPTLLRLVSLWLLVDPLLGTLWELSGPQGLWRRLPQAQLPPPPRRGFALPYAQPGSTAGNLSLWLRRYRRWWAESYWPEMGSGVVTFGLGLLLAPLLAFSLGWPIFGLTLLSLLLIVLASVDNPDPATPGGGRLQALGQFFIPWLMGIFLAQPLNSLLLGLALCYTVVYLGGLRLVGRHHRAEILFFFGQVAVLFLLLALRLLPGAGIVALCLVTQGLFRTVYPYPETLLQKSQPYLVLSLLAAAIAIGGGLLHL